MHDSRVTAPWFGPNQWVAVVQPVANGGIPSHHAAVELKITFKDGGAYDFHNQFAELKERVHQATQLARDSGQSRAGTGGVDYNSVHLEQLPAYEDPGVSVPTSQSIPQARSQAPLTANNDSIGFTPEPEQVGQNNTSQVAPPAEPPPGYEETQRDNVAEALDRSIRSRES